MQVTASRVNPRVVFSVVLSLALAVACVLPSYAHAGVMRDSNNLLPLEFKYFEGDGIYRQMCYVNGNYDITQLEPGTYTFSANVDKNALVAIRTDSTWIQQANNPVTFTIPEGYQFVRIEIRYDNKSEAESAVISEPMINAGSTALPYEPYGEQVLDLSGILPDFLQFWTDSLRVVLPAALGLFGVIFGIRLAVRKFRTVV